jgi:hypothetical protein
MKATEADGYITDNTNHTGVLSLVGLVPAQGGEVVLTRPILMLTGALLLATLVTALWMKFRLGLGAEKNSGAAERDVLFIGAFASLLTMIYQAFATYTIPDYILGVIIFGPVLARLKFWTAWDEALIAVTCYFLAVVYLLWFHFAEFGNDQPRTSLVYDVPLAICNLCVFALFARCAWRTFGWYAPQLRGHQRA